MARVPGKRKTGDGKWEPVNKETICPENVRLTLLPSAPARSGQLLY